MAVAQKLREWAVEQDKSERAADEQWVALTHAETATFFRKAADEFDRLSHQLAEAQGVIERFREEFEASSEFDNFECDFGATLGECVETNHCIPCAAKRMFAALTEAQNKPPDSPADQATRLSESPVVTEEND